MIDNTKRIRERVFIAKCEDYLSAQADWLLDLFDKIEKKNKENEALKDNSRIQVGWTIFTISEQKDGVHILAPDYNGNPFKDMTDDLTISLWVQLEQNYFLKRVQLEGEKDKVIVAKGTIELDNLYLERAKNYEKGDSGWYIGPVDESINTDELEAYYLYQLLKIRPALIQVLALPKGYIVVFIKDSIEAVLDQKDIDIWK